MHYEADTHTHTIASGHAYNTILEMVQAAADKGLKALALTDHTDGIPGAPTFMYFNNYKIIPRKQRGITLLMGAEVNIFNDGHIDLEERVLKRQDIVIASIHKQCFTNAGIDGNTEAVLKIVDNPFVDIIGHPDDDGMPLDYERIVKRAAETGTVLELNEYSYIQTGLRTGCKKNQLTYLALCKQYGVHVTIGSDAHFCDRVGAHAFAEETLAEAEFPEELVLNSSAEKLCAYLKARKDKINNL